MVHEPNRIATKSLVRRLKVQLEPEKMAQFLAATIDADVLQKAQDIIIRRDLDELQDKADPVAE